MLFYRYTIERIEKMTDEKEFAILRKKLDEIEDVCLDSATELHSISPERILDIIYDGDYLTKIQGK